MFSLNITMKYVALLMLVVFLQEVSCSNSMRTCRDDLNLEPDLCKRWHGEGLCGKTNVRTFCQRTCKECSDNDENDKKPHYVGCYHDTAADTELKYMPSQVKVTVHSCVDLCDRERYLYAGLRDGTFCMCGNVFGSHGEVLNNGCDEKCGGPEKCGAKLQNAIYKTHYNVVHKQSYIDRIEELIIGKDKQIELTKKRQEEHKRTHIKVPHERKWDFMEWLEKNAGKILK